MNAGPLTQRTGADTVPPRDAHTIRRAARVIRWLFCVFCGTAALAVPIMLNAVPPLNPYAAYLAPVPYAVFLGLTVLLFRTGTDRIPKAALVLGVVFLLGGVAFDLVATVVHSPDLAREANPAVLVLRARGHSVRFVYVYGVVLEVFVGVVNCMLWAAMLRHRRTWVRSSLRNTRSRAQFLLKAMSGKTFASWRSLTERFTRAQRLRAFYHVLWVLVPMRLGAQVNRWYLGASWFRWVPQVREPYVALAGIVLFELALIVWLCRRFDAGTPCKGVAPDRTCG